MNKISVVGGGNVASHLFKALEGKGDIRLVNPRTLEELPPYSDIIIISVKDDAIASVAQRLKGKAAIIAHTSGSVPIQALDGCAGKYGVFYPLQTFTKGTEMTYSDIPFFIEGNDEATRDTLADTARLISEEIHFADSACRKRLHLASVFACNFSNCLVGIADSILKGKGMDYTLLLPLLRQTVAKLSSVPPAEAQTGPAVREDYPVMDAHIKMLKEMHAHNLASLYKQISDIIILNHKNGQSGKLPVYK